MPSLLSCPGAAFWLSLALAPYALGSHPGAVDVKGSIGYTVFADDGIEEHLQTGASARIYVTRRFSVEPEFQYLYQSSNHHDIVFIPNVNWDFRSGRVVPYVTGGAGWMRQTRSGFGTSFSSGEWLVQTGAGVKLYINDRFYVAPEFRVGWFFHMRANVAIGYTFR